MEKNLIQQTSELIARDFGLEIGEEPISEQELFDLVANEVAYMLEHRLETLFSLLYRLDVSEKKQELRLTLRQKNQQISASPAILLIAKNSEFLQNNITNNPNLVTSMD